MPPFVEFFLIALALYLLDSLLWPPLRGVVLWRGRRAAVLLPDRWLALRETGLVPLPPFWAVTGLAPCQAPPLAVDDGGNWIIETSDGRPQPLSAPGWDDVTSEAGHLVVGTARTKLSSPRGLERLRRSRSRGLDPAAAVALDWKLALSPARAAHESRRWHLVSRSLFWWQTILTWGFFAVLPLVFWRSGPWAALFPALCLWALMAMISVRLWWLGHRVYPAARSALVTDALLALVVPFHAMRAGEIAAVHAFGSTHPAALIATDGGPPPAWLGQWVRRVVFPRPGMAGDEVFSAAVTGPLGRTLAAAGWSVADFTGPPVVADDPESVAYCPRCHGRFTAAAGACSACLGLPLRPLP